MKKTALMLSLFLCAGLLYAENAIKENNGFSITDIFQYNQPVKKGDNEKKISLNLAGGYTEKSGNTESTSTTYSFAVKYDNNITEFRISGFGSYGKLKGVVNDNKGSGTVNFDHYLFWRIEFFSYTMSDYNKITELEHRNGSGCGIKFSIIRNDYIRLDLSGAPIYQYEKYEEEDPVKTWRWSLRGRFEIFPFDNNFHIKYAMFYIPEIGDNKNYRTIHDTVVYKKLVGALGIGAGYRREYNTYNEKAFIETPALKKTASTTYIQATLTL
jgi:hypothetical protein